MKKIDTRSLLLGAFLATGFIILTSSTSLVDHSSIEFVPTNNAAAIYNHDTNTLYTYRAADKKINTTPYQIFKVAKDGSSLTPIKQ